VVVAGLALNAGTLNGFGPDDLVDWTQMTGIPADLADGDDDILSGLVCSDGQVALWSGSAWNCADDAGQVFGRTFVVGPVGDPLANGSALLAAMAAIPTPGSAADAWLLKIEPGRYDLGTQTLQMKSRVDIEGSGRLATVITSTDCGLDTTVRGTVLGAADAEIRRLTVENLCSDPLGYGYAVYSDADRLTLREVLVRAAGVARFNIGVSSRSDRLSISDSVIRGIGGAEIGAGIEVVTQGGLILRNVIAEGNGTPPNSRGAWVNVTSGGTGLGFAVLVEGCTFRASNTASSLSSYALSIDNDTTLEVMVNDSVANASGTSTYAFGAAIWAEGGVTRLTRLRAHGNSWGIVFGASSSIQSQAIFTDVSASADWDGIELWADVSALVTINGGHIQGGVGSVVDDGPGSADVHISHARLVGPTSLSSPSSTCTAVTDGTPTFYASTCP
jgi:hypothetical protein